MLFQIAAVIAAYYLGKSGMEFDDLLKLIQMLLDRDNEK